MRFQAEIQDYGSESMKMTKEQKSILLKRLFWFSPIATALVAVYDGYLGITRISIWHYSICIYLILLCAVRGIMTLEINTGRQKKYRHVISRIILVLINLSLIVPIRLVVTGKRVIYMGVIPTIVMAVYAVYKVSLAIFNMKRVDKENDMSKRMIMVIGVIDALVSILSFQNTFIIGIKNLIARDLSGYVSFISTVIYIIILILTISVFTEDVYWMRDLKKKLSKINMKQKK